MFWPALHLHTTGQQKRALFACQGGPLPSATARLSLCCRALQRLLHTDHAQAARNFGVRIDIDIGVFGPGSWSLSTRSSSTSACKSGELAWRLEIVNKLTNIVKRKVYIMANDPHIGERIMRMRSGVWVQACVSAVSIFV